MRFLVIAVSVDSHGVRTHQPVAEFDNYQDAEKVCRKYRDTMKHDYVDAYLMRIDPAFPLVTLPEPAPAEPQKPKTRKTTVK